MSRKPRKFTCLGTTLGQPRASWGLKRPQGKYVKTRVWDPSWAILGPPGASWRLLGAILVYLRASWGCPGASKGPRHVKTHVPNAISRDGNIFSRHSMFSNLLHICRAPPCIRRSSSSAGVTRSVRDPAPRLPRSCRLKAALAQPFACSLLISEDSELP